MLKINLVLRAHNGQTLWMKVYINVHHNRMITIIDIFDKLLQQVNSNSLARRLINILPNT